MRLPRVKEGWESIYVCAIKVKVKKSILLKLMQAVDQKPGYILEWP